MRILERVDFNKYANSFKMEYEKFARTFKNWDSYEYQAMDQDAYDEIWKKVFGSFVDDSYYDEWMEFFEPIIQEVEMKVFGRVAESSDKNVVEIQEEVRISQGDQDIILEKGDKIVLDNKESMKEAVVTKSGWIYDPRNRAMSGYPTIEKEVEDVLITISYGTDDLDLPFEVVIENENDQEIEKFASIEGVKKYIYKYYRLTLSNKDFFTLIGE